MKAMQSIGSTRRTSDGARQRVIYFVRDEDALRAIARRALVLKEIQGLPTREVALILERSEGATEQLLVRARQTLRRRFEP
jgi:DNA-directed RNA polymerase specialized sigma24 family protein